MYLHSEDTIINSLKVVNRIWHFVDFETEEYFKDFFRELDQNQCLAIGNQGARPAFIKYGQETFIQLVNYGE